MGLRIGFVGRTEWSTVFFHLKGEHALARKNKSFTRAPYFRETLYPYWVFRSFPLCLCGVGYRQSRATLNGNPKGRTTLKMGFPFAGGYLLRQKFIWSEDPLFSFLLSFIDWELFCFPQIFSFLLSSDLWSGILLFLFFSFCSFLLFLSFHFLFFFDWEFGF